MFFLGVGAVDAPGRQQSHSELISDYTNNSQRGKKKKKKGQRYESVGTGDEKKEDMKTELFIRLSTRSGAHGII